jgi:hypothetical protein
MLDFIQLLPTSYTQRQKHQQTLVRSKRRTVGWKDLLGGAQI